MRSAAAQLPAFRALLSRRFGLALPDRFDRHLLRALDQAGAHLAGPAGLPACQQLEELPWTHPAWQAAIERITVRETAFFRQRGWWDSLAEAALRPLVAARRRDGSRRLRCLSIGCASGAEPYSLAILLERLIGREPGWTVEIVGADLCAAALEEARAGVFDPRALNEVSPQDHACWFRPAGAARFALDAHIRGKVDFRLFNLAALAEAGMAHPEAAALGGPADFVICRNLLIHVELARQLAFAHALSGLVGDGGMLAVAPVEATASWFAPLQFVPAGHAILFARSRAAKDRGAPRRDRPLTPAEPAATRPAPAAPSSPRPAPVPQGGADPLRQARQLADLGLLEDARRLCGEILSTSVEAGLLMALVCQALGDIPAAEAAALRALAADPGAPAAHYVFAIIQLRRGETARARHALHEAVRLLAHGDARMPAGGPLGIAASDIRQAARRLGAVAGEGGGRGATL